MIHNATHSWSGQPEYDAGIPAEWPKDVRYIDGTWDDSGRIWFRDPHELLTPWGCDLLHGNINRAIGKRTQGEMIVLDLECGVGFPSPAWIIASHFHGLSVAGWSLTADKCEVDARELYDRLSADLLMSSGVVADDFPHRHDGDSILAYAPWYVDHPWWKYADAVVINFYNQNAGQDQTLVATGRRCMARVAHRCAARRDVKVYATICAQYEHGPGEYVTADEWKATVDACAEHGVEPILWGRWRDRDAAEAMRRFMEGGGIKAVEAAGLTKTQGGMIV